MIKFAGAGAQNYRPSDSGYCRNDLHTRSYEAAKSFFADVFGCTYTPLVPNRVT